ncbi:Pentatricopeptide repeat-containing protein, chloroplastic [Ananas comosus]|uniref:Pentatricopeptide repeat-containing protein, chloroplastic n=1 Tax=Ananas comosus TaxID=4615 RepID=A0A199VWY8_ANACO|nr:Pentatricopeptide repeat-containing protein, chloroplastic [Ananas comosus]
MNFARAPLLSSTLTSAIGRNPTFNPTITLSILEAHLRRCRDPKHFLQIHAQMTVSGFIHDTFAASRLLAFSATSPFLDLDYSLHILHQIQNPNGFICNSVIRAHVHRNRPSCCLPLYKSMLRSHFVVDNYTYPILIHACAARFSVIEGKQMHTHVSKLGFDSDVYVVNTLINMYSVCGNLGDARMMFDKSPVLDSVSWNSILAAYVQAGDAEEAVRIFAQMPEQNTIAANSMIALFGKCNRPVDARNLFDTMQSRDIVTWTAMISCYEQNGLFREALEVFSKMPEKERSVDEVLMLSVLSACAQSAVIKQGESMHSLIVKVGLESHVNVQNAIIHMYTSCSDVKAAQRLFDSSSYLDQVSWNSMLAGYLKCGLVGDARVMFDKMPHKDVVSWSTMVTGYAQHDRFVETLDLFNEMQNRGIKPDETTLVSVISACTHLSALEQGKWVHTYIRRQGIAVNVFVGTTLIDMYMKCGCMETALEVFDMMEERATSTWNAVILGLAVNGLVKESLEKFSEMEKVGVAPSGITFVGVLGACRYAGLVAEGRHNFKLMQQKYGIAPNIKHYGCMVDLLGRVGFVKEAEELIKSMPFSPDVATWGALLAACKKHGETEIGERVGKELIELEPQHDGFHVLLSNIYASKGMWENVKELRGLMKQRGVVKVPGCSLIESGGIVHEFLAGDRTHPQIKEINEMLDEVARRLRIEGYRPDTSDVGFDIEEEEKETTLHRHSEKLAIAFGLISVPPPAPIRIMKNLRICGDCHAVAKMISKSFQREVIVRDRQLFHHFRDGVCSCGDYW